jgi:hypothetical protein
MRPSETLPSGPHAASVYRYYRFSVAGATRCNVGFAAAHAGFVALTFQKIGCSVHSRVWFYQPNGQFASALVASVELPKPLGRTYPRRRDLRPTTWGLELLRWVFAQIHCLLRSASRHFGYEAHENRRYRDYDDGFVACGRLSARGCARPHLRPCQHGGDQGPVPLERRQVRATEARWSQSPRA